MKEYFFFDHIRDKKHATLLEYDLSKRFYYFGDHFKNSWEAKKWTRSKFLNSYLIQFLFFLYKKLTTKAEISSNAITSNVYFNFGELLKQEGFTIFNVPWGVGRELSLLKFKEFVKILKFKKKLDKYDLARLLSEEFALEIDLIKNLLKKILIRGNIKGIFLPNDVEFFSRLAIDLGKEIGIPSFVVLHGTALRYGNTVNDNRADFLCVFGDVMKTRLVNSGFSPNKIIVLGHPTYSNKKKPDTLRFEFNNVLVISKPLPGQPVELDERLEGRSKDTNRLKDRSNAILYLWKIQYVLQKCGVSNARLRVHPSENSKWYEKFLDMEFFQIDHLSLSETLAKSSLVIGPSSSLFLDAIYAGVNYTIFEPRYDDGLDMLNDPVGAPFDGTDIHVPVAANEEMLENILNLKKAVNLSILSGFVKDKMNFEEVLIALGYK